MTNLNNLSKTELINKLEALQKKVTKENYYPLVFESSAIGIGIFLPSGRVVAANKTICEMTGYSLEELLILNFQDTFVAKEERIKLRNHLKKNGVVNHFDVQLYKKNRKIYWGELFIKTIEFNGEEAFLTNILNITKIKEKEERLLLTQFAVDHSRESNFWMGHNGQFIYVNKAASESLGYSQEELLNMTIHDIDPLFTVDLWPANWKELKEKGYLKFESQHQRKNGATIPVIIVANFLEFQGREYNCAFALNISERKKNEMELQEHHKELEAKLEERTKEIKEKSINLEESQKALSYLLEDMSDATQDVERSNKKLIEANNELESFSYFVSHDLKAPLRAIDGYAHAILEDYYEKFDSEGKELLNLIHKNVKNMDQLIKDLLEFSRIGRTVLVISGIDMKSLLNDVFNEIYQFIPDRKIQLKINGFHPVKSDKRLLQQVFLNLMTNAVKFTSKEENAVIEVGSRIENNEIIYYLKDNGIGFDMKYVDKLFEVFQRLHSVKEYTGTGVGLALVQRIINRLGGRVWAEGTVGVGATFFFTLPVRKNI